MEFYYKNKFEKLVHLAGFLIRIYHAVRSPERQISVKQSCVQRNLTSLIRTVQLDAAHRNRDGASAVRQEQNSAI